MDAGKRDRLVILQTYTTSQDDYGEEVQAWDDLGTEWAAVFYGKGDERRQAAVEQGVQSATFQMLANTVTRAVTLKDRIIHDGFIWNIVGLAPMNRGTVEITATATGEEYEPGS